MKLKNLFLFLIIALFSINAISQESCGLYKYFSPEMNACEARNKDRELQTKRYEEEKQARKDAAYLEKIISSQEKEKSNEDIRKKSEADFNTQQYNKKQQEASKEIKNNKALDEEIEDHKIELLSFMIFMIDPINSEINKLSEIGKCKESHLAIDKSAKKSPEKNKYYYDLYHAMIAETCDNNKILTFKHYKNAADRGSHIGKTKIKEITAEMFK